jgi:genome maintenance exonuclease 1
LEPTLQRIEPVSVQMHVWSDTLQLQGYLDCLGFLDGVPTLIDCKNSKREKYEEHIQDYFLQCTMYSMLLYEMTGLKVKQSALLIARRDSNFPQIEIRSIKPFVAPALKRIQEYHSTREQNKVNS